MKNPILKEAIADARQLREVAANNAKKAIEESLAPKIQEMIDSTLEENEQLDENEELDENINLDAILQELEAEEDPLNESEDLEEAKKDDEKDKDGKKDDKDSDKKDDKEDKAEDKKDDKPAAPKKDDAEPKGDELDGLEDETELVKDLDVETLKTIIGDIVAAQIGGPDDLDLGGDLGVGDDLTGDLGSDEDPLTIEPELDGGLDDEDLGDEEGDFNLEELLAELDSVNEGEDELNETESADLEEVKKELEETKAELREAYNVVQELKDTFNEVNLTNAKLLHVNNIFTTKNLTSAQKLKVIEAMDKAENIKEAKLIFESIANTATPKTSTGAKRSVANILGESMPKPTANRNQPIINTDAQVSRWQKLAGIKVR